MNYINNIYYPALIESKNLERSINDSIPCLKKIGVDWFCLSILKKTEILYALVDYWCEVFDLAMIERVNLMQLASIGSLDSCCADDSLYRYPIGVVEIEGVTDQNLLSLLMVNLAIGNVVIVRHDNLDPLIFKLLANVPYSGLINFVKIQKRVQLQIDKHFDASNFGASKQDVEELSICLRKEEWDEKREIPTSGY